VNTFVTNVRRQIYRSVFFQGYYPVSRFQRIEGSLRFAQVDDAIQSILEPYDPRTNFAIEEPFMETNNRAGVLYLQPSAAWVFDNSLFGYTGPFYGRRSRFEVAQALGDWRFTQVTADYRRYDKLAGPVILSTRLLYFGRLGRDANRFRIFGAATDLIRGHTSGSYRRNECLTAPAAVSSATGCAPLDRLAGTELGVASAEIRFPLLTPALGFVPQGIPPLEAAIFYDIGMVWDEHSTLKWTRQLGDDPISVRTPLQAVGWSVRMNLFGFAIGRLDYAVPLNRRGVSGLWTFSLGPAY
jgi:outer membrane protein assembly factor BamA